MDRPNIVVFFSDQQRRDTVTPRVTPHLYAMAEERGVRFDDAVTCQPVCGPARACVQTGQYATRTGCFTNARALPEDADTIAKILRRGGYRTAYVGKWHLASGMTDEEGRYETKAVPEARRGGYEYWRASDVLEFTSDGSGGYVFDEAGRKLTFEGCRADRITDFALEFIRGADADKPFFLFLSHIEPHHQNSSGRFECTPGDRAAVEGEPLPEDLRGSGVDRDQWEDYLGCCHALDRNFKRVVDALAQRGVLENTVVFYTSDHGCHFKTRNAEYKRSCHEASIAIPMYVFGGGYAKGAFGGVVSLLDLPASVLRAAGAVVPDAFDGLDLLAQAQGDVSREAVYIQISEDKLGRAVRTDRWTYAVRAPRRSDGWSKPFSKVYVDDYLYDLRADPAETRNLIHSKEHREVKARLRKMLIDLARRAGEPPFIVRGRLIAPKR